MQMRSIKFFIPIFGLALLTMPVYAERIKDVASVDGVRINQLVGYGLVVGLDGSGDQTTQAPFTVQSMKSMLAQFGIVLPPNVNPQLKNVAAVAIHAELPAFAKPGQTIDITVSSLGNAKSLRGGSLLMTPLKGADGEVYAIAQGNLAVGGLGVSGSDGSKITVNIPSVGRIPNGATIERASPTSFGEMDALVFNLHTADFTTAKRLADTINATIGAGTAQAVCALHQFAAHCLCRPTSSRPRRGWVAAAFHPDVRLSVVRQSTAGDNHRAAAGLIMHDPILLIAREGAVT